MPPTGPTQSFNQRFWYGESGYLYDVIDGENGMDAACRPNQILAISLPHPVLEPQHWQSVFDVVDERLLTPMGLRSWRPENRTTSRDTTATCGPAMRPIIRAPFGRG